MFRHSATSLLGLMLLFAAAGATCPTRPPPQPLAPTVFTSFPTTESAVAAVNASSASIQTLRADRAQVTSPGMPPLQANLVVERPRRFRMRAEASALTGAELDLGSNDELFWMWIRRNRPPAIYYARHDKFERSAARHLMPIEPEWLIEALGLVYLDPAQQHEGPILRPDGNLEIRTHVSTADGEAAKVLVLHPAHAWVLEQHLFDPRGQLVASVKASKHRWYPVEQVSLPGKIEVNLPASQMSFAIDLGSYAINQMGGDPAQLWSIPQIEGYPLVDIADPRFQPPGFEGAEGAAPAADNSNGASGYPSRYRGYGGGR